MKAVIMAGGEGIRLRPFTYLIPKPLLPLGNETVIEHTIRLSRSYGFDEIFITTNYRAKDFERCLNLNSKYKITVHLVKERKKLGTVGALKLASEFLTEPFLLVNGDIIFDTNLSLMVDFHIKNKADITLGVTKHSVEIPYGVVDWKSNRELRSLTEKPTSHNYVNSGIYMMNPSIVRLIPRNNHMDFPALLEKVKQNSGKIFVYDIGSRWLDVGRFADYENAIEAIQKWEA